MSTRSSAFLDLHVGCGAPLTPVGLTPRTPLSPSTYVLRPRDFNLDESMFVAGVRKGYEEEFHRSISEAMDTYAKQITKLVLVIVFLTMHLVVDVRLYPPSSLPRRP